MINKEKRSKLEDDTKLLKTFQKRAVRLFRSYLYKKLTKKKITYKLRINVQRTEDNPFQMKPVCSTIFENEDNLMSYLTLGLFIGTEAIRFR